jgi:type IV pilus assembly protein PilV
MKYVNIRKRDGSAGFTLIEVLVSLVVLLVGLLGLAGLQLYNIKANYSAYLRTQASIAAYDILDQMRANKVQALDGDYDRAIPATVTETGCTDNSSSSDIAEEDLDAWTDYLWGTLPNGCASVAVDGTTSMATVVVQWNDNRGEVDGAGKDTQQFTMTSQL